MLCVAGSDSLPILQGTKCDVREGQDVKDLVGFAQRNLKYIDIWVLMLDLLSLLPYLLNVNSIFILHVDGKFKLDVKSYFSGYLWVLLRNGF